MNLVVTRTSFCSHCKSADRPLKDELFLTFGSRSQVYSVQQCTHEVPFAKKGFTPHTFTKHALMQLESGNYVKYMSFCSVIGCGVEMSLEKDTTRQLVTFTKHTELDSSNKTREYTIYYYLHRWKKGMMEVRHWNALVALFKDESYWLNEKNE